MKHIFAIALCAIALPLTSASPLGAEPLAAAPALLPGIEVGAVYLAPLAPADFACSPYTCTEGGRRNPAINPEGDVFPTQLGD